METDRKGPVKILCGAIFFVALLFAGTGARVMAADAGGQPEAAVSVAVPHLLADKQRYKDKLVRVRGYVSIQVENHSLFLNKEEVDTLYGDPKLGIWLRLSETEHEKFKRFHHSYRVVTGRFRTSDCEGHMCLFGGTLEEVTIGAR